MSDDSRPSSRPSCGYPFAMREGFCNQPHHYFFPCCPGHIRLWSEESTENLHAFIKSKIYSVYACFVEPEGHKDAGKIRVLFKTSTSRKSVGVWMTWPVEDAAVCADLFDSLGDSTSAQKILSLKPFGGKK